MSVEDDSGGGVFIFNEVGEPYEIEPLKRNYSVSVLEWHPTKLILAVAWKDGGIYVWNLDNKDWSQTQPLHKASVMALQWSSFGTRIVSGDEVGMVFVWKIDSKGRPQSKPLCQENLPEPIQQIILPDSYTEVHNLVRAAVNGDQKALDMFNWKEGQSDMKFASLFGHSESADFFLGGASGGVYHLVGNGNCIQLFSVESQIIKLMFYLEKNILVTLTSNLMLSQHAIDRNGQQTKEIMRVKLSGRPDNPNVVWAGKGILAMATGENVLRMFDLDRGENYLLSLENHSGYISNEQIHCVDYCKKKGIIAAGTQMGNVAMWKYTPFTLSTISKRVDGEKKWKLQSPISVNKPVLQLTWSIPKNLLCVNLGNVSVVLSENLMCYCFNKQVAVIQRSPDVIAVEMFATGKREIIECNLKVKGIYTTKKALAIWNGKKIHIYEYSTDESCVNLIANFGTDSMNVCIFEQSLLVIEQSAVKVKTFQGTVKQVLEFTEIDGQPICMDVSEHFLVVGTANGVIQLFELSKRKIRPHAAPKALKGLIPDFGSISSVKCSCTGNQVSILAIKNDGNPDSKLYIWDVESDDLHFFNFETGWGERDENSPQLIESDEDGTPISDANRSKSRTAKDVSGRYPVSHFWDPKEKRLLCCEARLIPNEEMEISKPESPKSNENEVDDASEMIETMIVSLFSTTDNGILIQENISLQEPYQCLIGIEIPYYYVLKSAGEDGEGSCPSENADIQKESAISSHVTRLTMQDFVGLESSDKKTQDAMMDFRFHLAIGNLDEAFKAIKLIKSEAVWENMARMCVKTQRLDVAKVCLGKMGHAQGVRALNRAIAEPELEARVAMLALHLNMVDEAESLLKSCKRFDLLNNFYQNCGEWDKALEVAELYDRVHLRSTYHSFAKHLEAKGSINAAIENYKKAETHVYEVPRMLYGNPTHLLEYIQKSKDKALYKWYAQYLESIGDFKQTVKYYEIAQDYLSLVRVFCFLGEIDKAGEICNETGDRAACYQLARQYETQGVIKQAINFFTRSGTYGNAIRLCKEHGFEDQILNLALLGQPEDMIEAARYFEQKPGMEGNAVMLYNKAGNFSKALELSFSSKQFGALQTISAELDERADPELLERCAEFFLENAQYDKAVEHLAMAKKYWDAIKLIVDKNITVSPELVKKLSPSKGANEVENRDRMKILEAIGNICMHQGEYHLATKKFTQSGNRVKAMKCLLKSGDTEKISFFATVSRQKEIYIMAANYLQSLDWMKDLEIIKNIVTFYTKAKAMESLAAFYDMCAQAEIDEYQNYEKALGALGEAYKCLQKAMEGDSDCSPMQKRMDEFKQKIVLIRKFVNARKMYAENPDDAAKQCLSLLEEPELDSSVRVGDVYAFLIEHYACQEKWNAAYNHIEELKNNVPNANITYYVSPKTVELTYQQLGIALPKGLSSKSKNGLTFSSQQPSEEDEESEFVEEEIFEN